MEWPPLYRHSRVSGNPARYCLIVPHPRQAPIPFILNIVEGWAEWLSDSSGFSLAVPAILQQVQDERNGMG